MPVADPVDVDSGFEFDDEFDDEFAALEPSFLSAPANLGDFASIESLTVGAVGEAS